MDQEPVLGVVAGRDQEICQLRQLIICELELVLDPVVLVCSLEALETFLDRGWNWLLVVQVTAQVHQQVGDELRHVVRKSRHERTQGEDTGVTAQNFPPGIFFVGFLGFVDLLLELLNQTGELLGWNELAMQETTKHLSCLHPHF